MNHLILCTDRLTLLDCIMLFGEIMFTAVITKYFISHKQEKAVIIQSVMLLSHFKTKYGSNQWKLFYPLLAITDEDSSSSS